MSDSVIGENSFILEGANIQPFAEMGNDTIIWCQTHIGHHTMIGDHVYTGAARALKSATQGRAFSDIGECCVRQGEVACLPDDVLFDFLGPVSGLDLEHDCGDDHGATIERA